MAKHCWSCAKSTTCKKFVAAKRACKEHRYADGLRSEKLQKKK